VRSLSSAAKDPRIQESDPLVLKVWVQGLAPDCDAVPSDSLYVAKADEKGYLM